jgi:hypothetical protein
MIGHPWEGARTMRRAILLTLTLPLLIPACGTIAADGAAPSDDGGEGRAEATAPGAPTDGATTDAPSPPLDGGAEALDGSADAPWASDGGLDARDVATDAGVSVDGAMSDGDAWAGTDSGSFDATLPMADSGPSDAGESDAIDPNPLAHCQAGARDVFYVNVAGYPGPFVHGAHTYTNLDSNWNVYSPTDIFVDRISGTSDSLEITPRAAGPLAPGSYTLGPSATGPSFNLALGGAGCSVVSGTLNVVDFESRVNDAGNRAPSSLLLSYDVQCQGYGSTIPVEGCVRYERSAAYDPTKDAGVPTIGGDGGILAPCASGGYVFYVDGHGSYGGIAGPMAVTAAQGTWNAGVYAGMLQLRVTDITPWQLVANVPSLGPGTYTSSGNAHAAPWIQVQANGMGCGAIPTGTFTIANVASDGDGVSGLVMGFDLSCGGSGTLRGCVSYGN